MQAKRLINALKKAGFEVKINERQKNLNYCKGNGRILEFYIQDEQAICVNSRRENDNHDSRCDYTAGYFCRTIKDAVNSLLEV